MHTAITIHLIYKWRGSDNVCRTLQTDQADHWAEFMPNFGHRTFCSLYSSLPQSCTPQQFQRQSETVTHTVPEHPCWHAASQNASNWTVFSGVGLRKRLFKAKSLLSTVFFFFWQESLYRLYKLKFRTEFINHRHLTSEINNSASWIMIISPNHSCYCLFSPHKQTLI